jgi:hypothetical protein
MIATVLVYARGWVGAGLVDVGDMWGKVRLFWAGMILEMQL